MANIRHTVVVRKDLMLSSGLLAAQVAHISDQFMRIKLLSKVEKYAQFTPEELAWFEQPYLSVLAVNCAEDLMTIKTKAYEQELPCFVWEDVIPSPTFENTSIKAVVGVSIGPADFDKIKMVTGALKLY